VRHEAWDEERVSNAALGSVVADGHLDNRGAWSHIRKQRNQKVTLSPSLQAYPHADCRNIV
jgi:hypothetical protein